ncbi:MAG: SpvB/TcaC N-terminal domain-containing protein, partial [Acidobacteriota bacterium]
MSYRAFRGFVFSLIFLFCLGSAGAPSWGAVGEIRGSFGVDPGGSAVYAIPVRVPPGTGGMQPRLTLVYESGVPDGPMGVGWRIEGLERIDRCRPTAAQDGVSGPIDFSSRDRFCLDGERLVAISGAYGASGTVYHTERESHIRVTSRGSCGAGPCWFELVRKDGTVLELGRSLSSRILAEGRGDVRVWAVDSHRDPRGNRLRVEYLQEFGAFYPRTIHYTENAGLAATRRVDFRYRGRFSGTLRFDQGSAVRLGQILSSIETFVGGARVKEYRFEYDDLAGLRAPRLERVSECDGSGDCLPATHFGWQAWPERTAVYGFSSAPGFDVGGEDGLRAFADVDGDGRADFCRELGPPDSRYLSCALAGASGFQGAELTSALGQRFDFGYPDRPRGFHDVDGDGRADYCRIVGNSPSEFLSCALASEAGFGLYDFSSPPGLGLGFGGSLPRAFTDVNGDGRTDFCRAAGDPGSPALACALAGDSGFEGAEVRSAAGFDFGYPNLPRAFVDVNGDGRSDFCRAVGNWPYPFLSCALSRGDGFVTYGFNSAPGFKWGHGDKPWQFADVNGDGRMDYCRGLGASPNVYLSCALALGSGFGSEDYISDPTTPFDFGAPDRPRALVDMDGDRRADYCRFVGTSNLYLSCAVAGQRGFGHHDLISDPEQHFDPGYPSPRPRAFVPVASGSGASFCRVVGNPPSLVLSCTRPDPRGGRVKSVLNGLGENLEIVYSTLDDPEVHLPDSAAVYPARDVRGGGRAVVAAYSRSCALSSGPGSFRYSYRYVYSGARTTLDGRGWQGFREVTRIDPNLGLVTKSELLQEFPFTGMTESTSIWCDPIYGQDPKCPSFVAVRRSTRSYETRTPRPGVIEVLPSEVLDEALEYGQPGTATRRSLEYDAYGNAVFERTLSSTPRMSFELFTHRQFFSDPGRNRFGFTTRVTKSRDAEGGDVLTHTEWVYDPDSLNAVEVARWDSSRGSFLRTRFAYDLFGNLIRRVAPEGEAEELVYDPVHRTFPISASSQAGPGRPVLTSRYGHDPRFGVETSRIDANGTVRVAEYDGFGRLERVSGPHPETGEERALMIQTWRHEAGLTVRETHRRESWDGDRWSIRQEHLDSLRRPIL